MLFTVEPKDIAVYGEKCLIQEGQRVLDTAARVKELRLLGNLDVRRFATAKMRGDHCGLVVDIDDNALNSDKCQPIDRMIEQGPVVYLEKGFRNGFGQRAQPRAAPGCQHHSRPR